MILPAAVVVPEALASRLADVVSAHLRRTGDLDVELARLVVELRAVALPDVAVNGDRSVTFSASSYTVVEYAEATGLPLRTVRYRCQTGSIPARKRGRTWSIELPPSSA